MAHEIDQSNSRSNMAYVVATPWHGLGAKLSHDSTMQEWLQAAGMGYTVQRAPVQFMNGSMHSFDGKEVLYRDDTNAPLGIVSDAYKIVQPAEVLDFFAGLCEKNDFSMETAGCLKGGAVYWALAKTGHSVTLSRGDTTNGYVLLSTSADGSRATDARFTSIRVVCNNTLTVALAKGSANAVKTRHSRAFDANATKVALGLEQYDSAWDNFRATLQRLEDTSVSKAQATELFSELLRPAGERAKPRAAIGAQSFDDLMNRSFGGAYNKTPVEKDRAIRGLEELENSYYCAPGATPGNAYGIVQAVTHYIDHSRGNDSDKRLTSAWFGQGETLKNRAMELALSI